MDLSHLLISLILIFAGAKVLGELAGRIGQPSVLGELLAGVVLGVGVLRLVNPEADVIVLLADLGVILLLFEAGLATDIQELLSEGWRAFVVACIGVILPFAGGYAVATLMGYKSISSVFVGAVLVATSVGITVRVLSDLGKLGTREAKIILGAAVVDDILGLIILSVIRDLGVSHAVDVVAVLRAAGMAVAFVAVAVIVGGLFAKQLVVLIEKMRCSGALVVGAVAFAFAWSVAAELAGSAAIVGAFAAGLALGRTRQYEAISTDIKPLVYIFAPIFFVKVGASLNVRYFNPFNAANHSLLLIMGLLLLVAVAGKALSGVGVFSRRINNTAVGIGMLPRGEVGLIFVETGKRSGVLPEGLYGALVGVIALTTFFAPPLLKFALSRRPPRVSLWAWFFEPARKRASRIVWGR